MLLEWLHPILQGRPELLAPPHSHPTRSTATFVIQDRHLRTKATDLATESTAYQTHWHTRTIRRDLKNEVRAPAVSAPPTQQQSWLNWLQSLESHLQQEQTQSKGFHDLGFRLTAYAGGVERLRPVFLFTKTGLWLRSPAFSGFYEGNEYVVREAARCGQGLLALPKKRNPSLHMSHSLLCNTASHSTMWASAPWDWKGRKCPIPEWAKIAKWDNA